MPPEKIPQALKALDVDGDGKISLADMRDAVIQVWPLPLFCHVCPARRVLPYLSCYVWPARRVLQYLSCYVCPAMCVLLCLSCYACPAVFVLLGLSCCAGPTALVLSCSPRHACSACLLASSPQMSFPPGIPQGTCPSILQPIIGVFCLEATEICVLGIFTVCLLSTVSGSNSSPA